MSQAVRAPAVIEQLPFCSEVRKFLAGIVGWRSLSSSNLHFMQVSCVSAYL